MLSILASDKTPFIIALFIGLLTWFANKAVTDSESLVLLGYSIEGACTSKFVKIKNLSIRKTLKEGVFAVVCADSKPCLQNKDGGYATVRLQSPYGILQPSFEPSDDTIVQLKLSIPAGGEIEIVPDLTRDTNLRFFLNNVEQYEQIRFVGNENIVAFVFGNYYLILFVCWLSSVLVFAIYLLALLVLQRRLNKQETTRPVLSTHGDEDISG